MEECVHVTFGEKINYVADQQTATQNNTVDRNTTNRKKKKNPKQETISTQCPARNKCFKERMSDLPGA